MRPVAETPYLPQPSPRVGTASDHLSGLNRSLLGIFLEYAIRINAVFPKDGTESISGPLKIEEVTMAELTASVNDYAIGDYSIARLSADAFGPWTITGIAAGDQGEFLLLINVAANTFVLAHQNVGSAAANQIITNTGADVNIAADDTAFLWYDSTTARWRMFA